MSDIDPVVVGVIEIKSKCHVLQNVVGCAKFLISFSYHDSFAMGVANTQLAVDPIFIVVEQQDKGL